MNPYRPLLELLSGEAIRHGLLEPSHSVIDAAMAFALVREMAYRRASDRLPATTIREWRGTCSGKHYLLKALFEELGLESRLIACTAWVRPEMGQLLPASAHGIMVEGPVPDVHNYLRLETGTGSQLVDATAPLEWERYGIPVNHEFIWGRDMRPLFEPLEEFVVPWSGGEGGIRIAQAFKAELLERHFSPAEVERRSRFFGAIAGGLRVQETD